jgi:hypothetical protein
MIQLFEISAPVIPFDSIGGIRLYSHISQLNEILEKNNAEFEMYSRFLAKYVLNEALEIHFNILNGKVYKLCAKNEYKGIFKDEIQIGTNLTAISGKYVNLVYRDFEQYFILDGVVLETVLEKNSQTNHWEDIVTSLSIYIRELDDEILDSEFIEYGKW